MTGAILNDYHFKKFDMIIYTESTMPSNLHPGRQQWSMVHVPWNENHGIKDRVEELGIAVAATTLDEWTGRPGFFVLKVGEHVWSEMLRCWAIVPELQHATPVEGPAADYIW